MLTEISCSKFKNQCIRFHSGLNTILGDNFASNSIGKSTFLLIIDFAFGGETYCQNKNNDIIKNIGHHSINWKFMFSGESYYFSRNTEFPSHIDICNERYITIQTITDEEYRDFLLRQYEINYPGCKFRNFIGLFSRIYGKDNTNERDPLADYPNEKNVDKVNRLIKIFGHYAFIEELIKNKKGAEDRLTAYQNAQKHDFIQKVSSQKEYKSIEAQIDNLNTESRFLREQILNKTYDLTTEQYNFIANLKEQLNKLRLEKRRINAVIRKLENNLEHLDNSFDSEINELKEFFPNANFEEISKIQEFHTNLQSVLRSEIKSEIDKHKAQIDAIEASESKLTLQISEVISRKDAGDISLDQLIDIHQKIDALTSGKNSYNDLKALRDDKKLANERYETEVNSILSSIQERINSQLVIYNEQIYKDQYPPRLLLEPKKYTYGTHDDHGTGSQYKNLILLDLAVLNLTKLPILIHDSLLWKNIAKPAIEKIIEIYTSFSDRQIFVAFDKVIEYNDDTQKSIKDSSVLELYSGGGELFGRSWNKKE